MLAAALEANQEMARLVAELREENAGLRAQNAQQAGELEGLRADLAVLQRMLFGRSSERAGRRDYSRLPRFEVFWDFPGGGYCCPQCGQSFTLLGDHVSGEQLDWQVIVRLVAHCRRRYKRVCSCRVPATVMAPGPPKAIGKGLFSNAFIAMLFTERYVAGRSMNSLVTGLALQG